MEFLGKNTRLALYTSVCSPVHFVLDRTSGKTQSEIFLELSSIADAERFAQRKTGKTLGNRNVNIEIVSSKEMLNAIFPRARADQWVTQEEIQNILTHAKTFKSPYTRKCPQRPFENFISILALFPWANKSVFAREQIELLYAGYSSLISILQWHIRKGKITSLDTTLLKRLIIAGTNLTDFPAEHKKFICSIVGFYPEAVVYPPPMPVLYPVVRPRMEIPMVLNYDPVSVPAIRVTEYNSHRPLESSDCEYAKLTDAEYTQASHASIRQLPHSMPDAATLGDSLIRLQASNLSNYPRAHSRPFSREGRPSTAFAARARAQASNGQSSLTAKEQWLLNARRAGIMVGVPAETSA